jgi:thiol-disulfide isomerase/thioredoxin
MYSPFSPERCARLLVLIGGLFALAATAVAAPANVLPFGMETWKELGSSRSRPMVVVFSTTDCGHCPAVIDSLAQEIRKSPAKARLAVVVMDGAGQEKLLRADRHYRQANLLYAFDGDGMALRFRVNPDWRGLTPYVALIPATGETRFHTGSPPADALRAFLRP